MAKNYFKIIPAVYLVLKNDEGILMMQRTNTGYADGMYSLPAGHLDGDESLQFALCREAQEEIGITIALDHPKLIHVQHRKPTEKDLSNERIDFYFEVTEWEGEPTNTEPHKCGDLNWFSPAPDNTIDHVKIALDAIAEGLNYSQYGW